MVAPSSRRPSTCGFATPAKLSTLASGTLESSGCGYPSSSAQTRPVGKMKSSPGSVETLVYAFWISSRRTSTSIGEDGCAIAHELHQGGCADWSWRSWTGGTMPSRIGAIDRSHHILLDYAARALRFDW